MLIYVSADLRLLLVPDFASGTRGPGMPDSLWSGPHHAPVAYWRVYRDSLGMIREQVVRMAKDVQQGRGDFGQKDLLQAQSRLRSLERAVIDEGEAFVSQEADRATEAARRGLPVEIVIAQHDRHQLEDLEFVKLVLSFAPPPATTLASTTGDRTGRSVTWSRAEGGWRVSGIPYVPLGEPVADDS